MKIMVDLLKSFFQKNNIDYNNQKFVIAVSTGVDSTVLLDLFLKQVNKDNIIICHVNHHKRLQSEDEALYINDFAIKNNIKIYTRDLYFDDEKENFQSLARSKRYDFFKEVMEIENANYLVLAHHADDLMETILMRIARGSSLTGYSGINECYQLNNGRYVIRPLLTISKVDIYKYAKNNNLKYYEDESNNSNDYTRNKIRHDIIPLLKDEYPNILDKFYEYSQVLIKASEEINHLRDTFINTKVKKTNNKLSFNRKDFNSLSDYLKEEVVFELLKPFMLSKGNINEILKVINNTTGNYNHIYNKFELIIEYDLIIFNFNIEKNKEINKEIVIDDLGLYQYNDNLKLIVSSGHSNLFTNKYELWYNYTDLPIVIRNRKPGDKIFINGYYKKIKDVLIDLKVPQRKRDELLLAVDKDGEVLIIFGIRKSDKLMNIKTNDICIFLKEENNYE